MQLKPYIHIDLNDAVWRMEIDMQANLLCLEIRNINTKSTSFSAIDLDNGTVHLKNLMFPHGWQCGLAGAAFGVMLVHGYQSEMLPVRKGLTAVDARTGDVLWEDHNLNLESIRQNGIEVYDVRMQPKRFTLIDAHTQQALIPRIEIHKGQDNGFIYPDLIGVETIRYLVPKISLHGDTAHFLRLNPYRIVSLHALSGAVINQHLYVFDDSGQLVFEDIIAAGIQKLQPEAFIVFKQRLIWLQNRSVVKVLLL